MTNSKLIFGLIAIFSLFLVACSANVDNVTTDTGTSQSVANEAINNEVSEIETAQTYDEEYTETGLRSITRDEIAEHSSSESCWVGYNDYVYDLTAWLNRHPGGADEITPHCGTIENFTTAYNNRHGEKSELRRSDAIGIVA